MDQAVVIPCQGQQMVGILHQPEGPAQIGLVVVVAGGPQYRVGVSRQFVMLGREMAARGFPTLRFDHRGVGDSGGEYKGFVDMSADIRSAVDCIFEQCPDLQSIVLWGECESATAVSFYAHSDERISGIFLVNPWIRTEEGQAKTYIRHYYRKRLLSKAFWNKILSGKVDFVGSAKSFVDLLRRSSNSRKQAITEQSVEASLQSLPLPQRLEKTTGLFQGRIDILTSGRDFIAQEFKDFVSQSTGWKQILQRQNAQMAEIADADHSFSRIEWREQLFNKIAAALLSVRGK